MCKIFGNWRRASVCLLFAAPLLGLMFTPACNGQGCGFSAPSSDNVIISSVTPVTWTAGHTYNVVLSGDFTGIPAWAPGPNCNYSSVFVDGSRVTVMSAPIISATQVLFTVTVSPNAKPGTATIWISCLDALCSDASAPVTIRSVEQCRKLPSNSILNNDSPNSSNRPRPDHILAFSAE